MECTYLRTPEANTFRSISSPIRPVRSWSQLCCSRHIHQHLPIFRALENRFWFRWGLTTVPRPIAYSLFIFLHHIPLYHRQVLLLAIAPQAYNKSHRFIKPRPLSHSSSTEIFEEPEILLRIVMPVSISSSFYFFGFFGSFRKQLRYQLELVYLVQLSVYSFLSPWSSFLGDCSIRESWQMADSEDSGLNSERSSGCKGLLPDTHWYTVKAIKGYDRWSIDWDLLKAKANNAADLWKVLRLVTSDKLWILARKNNIIR
jgi:hypothetical protein